MTAADLKRELAAAGISHATIARMTDRARSGITMMLQGHTPLQDDVKIAAQRALEQKVGEHLRDAMRLAKAL